MAPQPHSESSVTSGLRASLHEVGGVEDVIFDERGDTIVIVCAQRSISGQILEEARRIVAQHRGDPDAFTIITAFRTDNIERRARFDRVERYEAADRQVLVRAFLEWKGTLYSGDSIGEKGLAIELRTAAAAAIDALEKMTGEALGVRLVGVKQVRAFDAELTVVSLYRTGSPSHKLLGAVLTGSEPHRAAAVAVLNALNRTLGNLLSR